MKLLNRYIIIAFMLSATACNVVPAYKNASLSPERRADDLLGRMTLDEKIGQLICPYGWIMYEKLSDTTATYNDAYREFIDSRHGGWLWGLFRADPWTQKTLQTGLDTKAAINAYNALQKYAIDSSRLGIPILVAEEVPHGHMAIGSTVFPTGLGLASTWDPALMEQVGHVLGEELRAVGSCISYGPVLDLARELRWSRVEETYGEDPYLTSRMGGRIVHGMSVRTNGWDKGVVPTLKHYLAYGAPQGGHNGFVSVVGERDLYENILPVFKYCIDCGAESVMTSYNSIDGIPCTANKKMLNGILREQWGFDGVVVSDLIAIDALADSHRIAADGGQAAQLALEAGVDVDLGSNSYPLLKERIDNGQLNVKYLDSAVRRVLEMKFRLGIFEHPYADPEGYDTVRSEEHMGVALQAAREGVVLLENNGILPLNKNSRVAVIGPNANRIYNLLGDYTAPQPEDNICTPYEGICKKIGESNVRYVRGCGIKDLQYQNIDEAVQAAKDADVAIVFVGGSSARDFGTVYSDTGAALADVGNVSDMDSGEGLDRGSLELMGLQQKLLESIKSTGCPMVVVYIEGRPLDKRWAKEHADALLTQFYPGQAGGEAIADVLFGDYNPAGRLPVSVPYSVGQLPVHYNQPFPKTNDYIDLPSTPLYSFGYGLSYTTFSYNSISCTAIDNTDVLVTVNITNTGSLDGDEVVQIYVTDEVASTVRPKMQLKAFSRVNVKAGESVDVSFRLGTESFSLYNREMKCVVEPGEFVIKAGPSSDNIQLTGKVSLQ